MNISLREKTVNNKNNLTPEMQQRLDRWRKNLTSPKTEEIFKKKSLVGNFVPRRKDHCDEIREKEQDNV